MLHPKLLVLVAVTAIWSLSCGSANDASKKGASARHSGHEAEKDTPRAFSDQAFLEITPLADGCAYANDLAGGIWHVCGLQAIRVSLSEAIFDIEPDASGGAFGNSYSNGLWYLKGATAKRVVEVSDVTSMLAVPTLDPETRARGYWALLQAATQKAESESLADDAWSDYEEDYQAIE